MSWNTDFQELFEFCKMQTDGNRWRILLSTVCRQRNEDGTVQIKEQIQITMTHRVPFFVKGTEIAVVFENTYISLAWQKVLPFNDED